MYFSLIPEAILADHAVPHFTAEKSLYNQIWGKIPLCTGRSKVSNMPKSVLSQRSVELVAALRIKF